MKCVALKDVFAYKDSDQSQIHVNQKNNKYNCSKILNIPVQFTTKNIQDINITFYKGKKYQFPKITVITS